METVATWLGFAGAAIGLGLLLHAGFCAFTWRKFVLFDYGVYTNMIWNSAHGAPFRCLVDRSYLATHLSFTLALLGPIFRVWDHPFALWVAQWGFLAVGLVLLGRTALRLGVPRLQVSALALYFAGYHYTQQVLLSEFHGVSLYLLLVPWLYGCLRLNRRWVWLPWLLILGVREEAAALCVPMLLYFAVKHRWRAGYVYAVLSLAYIALATTLLYPWITGISLLARRHADLARNPLRTGIDAHALVVRLRALFWIVLPALVFLRRRTWLPLIVFPAFALLQALGGGRYFQYSLSLHYSAPVIACLAVAMVESLACAASEGAPGRTRCVNPWPVAVGLVLATAFSHRALGLLPGGRQHFCAGLSYDRVHQSGLRTLKAARRIPKDGVLICPSQLAGFCANRRDILDWRHYDPATQRYDLMFTELKYLDDELKGFRKLLADGTFGVTYFDGAHVILQRGFETESNRLVLEAYDRHTTGGTFLRSYITPVAGARISTLSIPTLHWRGTPEGDSEPMFAIGQSRLPPGDYDAVFFFGSDAPTTPGQGSWGALRVLESESLVQLAEREVEPICLGPQSLRSQRVPFSLAEPKAVEAAVIGRRADLWLQRADFVRRGEPCDL